MRYDKKLVLGFSYFIVYFSMAEDACLICEAV
jgi:hypothetical protein